MEKRFDFNRFCAPGMVAKWKGTATQEIFAGATEAVTDAPSWTGDIQEPAREFPEAITGGIPII